MNVAILGASENPSRYSYKALKLLTEYGHSVFPVSPKSITVDSIKCFNKLSDIKEKIDTLTLYVNPAISLKETDSILELAPRRVIMNPGTESDELKEKLEKEKILVEEACTLVLLKTKQF